MKGILLIITFLLYSAVNVLAPITYGIGFIIAIAIFNNELYYLHTIICKPYRKLLKAKTRPWKLIKTSLVSFYNFNSKLTNRFRKIKTIDLISALKYNSKNYNPLKN